ncbi:dTDP-4-dehydrorhamnose 3,5-epimerase [Gluconacetobacter entanii]|uniref:dTDP-4-dehydrorhamnose 3,5-epimerase n=1 Tax=Gluconacetobacter entanii TaxID=108528 RepID=A0ABT3KAU9_9PROT|nr:dTDP-4-dehydrorhamnose 3,5-epimerase family protein [Gluconacetobacter entanii]MCW4592162.1 dTDP-4-dehydrorhamnose 3,5-epimerase [Gluconacetobacter entanii]MCW4595829.1 dTDP-4-dehydrorhamnose 3,5-epimerase [Gluconacetobacter entanii]NPC87377.1 dTDP-4-dehydrorhamnose 3,5-epimerase family protein [Gluconacetobacter entanii]
MLFRQAEISGAQTITLPRHHDERGSFGRIFDRDRFAENGISCDFVQASISRTSYAGTLRGLHFQRAPYAEAKLVHCLRGEIYDVICDLRPDSPTYLKHQYFYLNCSDNEMIYIPPGCAHGFMTLNDDVEVFYAMSNIYAQDHASGLRFDDPALGISWPRPVAHISAKDLQWPYYKGSEDMVW